MNHRTEFATIAAALALTTGATAAELVPIPGLVVGMRHSVNQKPCELGWKFTPMVGGDHGVAMPAGYSWFMVQDDANAAPAAWHLPPGFVFGLTQSEHQVEQPITAFGNSPVKGPETFASFKKHFAGDAGAPAGQGFYWYESMGVAANEIDWYAIENLPKGTILGLKHSGTQKGKRFAWKGVTYDPANAKIKPPAGYARMFGGDVGAANGVGFYWYQKTTCPCASEDDANAGIACD